MGTQNSQSQQLYKRFGERIKELRIQKAWPQKTLAELSGMTVRSISQIERGEFNVTLSDLLALAQSFQTQIALLFRGLE